MATVTGKTLIEFQMREMARRAGKRYEAPDPYADLTKEQLEKQKKQIDAALLKRDEKKE